MLLYNGCWKTPASSWASEADQFEQPLHEYVGAKGAVGVASGTAALHLALLACGIGPGMK